MTYDARIGVDAGGRIVALDVDLTLDTGAYFTGAGLTTHNAVISAWGCYRLPNFRARARTAYTNRVPASHFRGTGKTQTTFSIECAIDSVARQLGIDPIEFRRRNILRDGRPQATGRSSFRVGDPAHSAEKPNTALVSRNSSKPFTPHSRPLPDCL